MTRLQRACGAGKGLNRIRLFDADLLRHDPHDGIGHRALYRTDFARCNDFNRASGVFIKGDVVDIAPKVFADLFRGDPHRRGHRVVELDRIRDTDVFQNERCYVFRPTRALQRRTGEAQGRSCQHGQVRGGPHSDTVIV